MAKGKRGPKSAILSALREACRDEAAAVEFFEKWRWNGEPACPHCGDVDVYAMKSAAGGRNRDNRWRCHGCKKMFTVRTGTVLEHSKLPIRVGGFAIWRASAGKKGY